MRDDTDCVDRRVLNGSSYFGPGAKCEHPTEAYLGRNGEVCGAMVSDSAKDGE